MFRARTHELQLQLETLWGLLIYACVSVITRGAHAFTELEASPLMH